MRKPSDRHGYSNRENSAYLEQRCGSSSKDTGLGFVLVYVTAVPRIRRDGAGGAWDIEHKLCDTLSARMGDVLGPTKGDVCESIGDL